MQAQQILDDLRDPAHRLRSAIPEVYAAYSAMSRAAIGDGVLQAKHKELIALAIAATRECDGCIASHARSAARRGVSREEVAEAMGVVILMNGGPGTVYGPRVLAAFDEYASAASGAPKA
jgi:AhpD family alkylhydroperoxidase